MLGDCVVTNSNQRTRLFIDGTVPIPRETDIMTLGCANSPAKRLYLALQFMYPAKQPNERHALYLRLVRKILKLFPVARPLSDDINNRILTGDLYKALKETRKLIAYEKDHRDMNHASKAYAKTVRETAPPRDLEANLLLNAAAKLQAVHDSWRDKPTGLNDALMYNRRLWTVFLDAVAQKDNKLPLAIRNNLTKLGAFVLGETFALMTTPKPNHLKSIIKINRGIAAGLRGKA
jgi:flagellar biosynthesis regulator FlaF